MFAADYSIRIMCLIFSHIALPTAASAASQYCMCKQHDCYPAAVVVVFVTMWLLCGCGKVTYSYTMCEEKNTELAYLSVCCVRGLTKTLLVLMLLLWLCLILSLFSSFSFTVSLAFLPLIPIGNSSCRHHHCYCC